MNTNAENLAELTTKVQMLVEQSELLRRHNQFLLEENNTISREFAQFRRAAAEREQALNDKLEQQRRQEQQRNTLQHSQYTDLQTQLRALEQGIEDLYKHKL